MVLAWVLERSRVAAAKTCASVGIGNRKHRQILLLASGCLDRSRLRQLMLLLRKKSARFSSVRGAVWITRTVAHPRNPWAEETQALSYHEALKPS